MCSLLHSRIHWDFGKTLVPRWWWWWWETVPHSSALHSNSFRSRDPRLSLHLSPFVVYLYCLRLARNVFYTISKKTLEFRNLIFFRSISSLKFFKYDEDYDDCSTNRGWWAHWVSEDGKQFHQLHQRFMKHSSIVRWKSDLMSHVMSVETIENLIFSSAVSSVESGLRFIGELCSRLYVIAVKIRGKNARNVIRWKTISSADLRGRKSVCVRTFGGGCSFWEGNEI